MKYGRSYNFSAGPAMMPEEVLEEIAAEMMNYRGSGMCVMEMSHRSKVFQQIRDEAESDLRKLMGIPDNYKVLFIQGGGHVQFAMVPMNLMKNRVGDYIITGQWAKKAWQEAKLYGTANAIASSEDKTFSYIPDCSDLPVDDKADYVYICLNNTIYGTKFHELPDTKGKPLVADVSSCFLSEPLDVSKFGIIWGGVQKNVGPAGMAIAIIRDDLLGKSAKGIPAEKIPTMMNYTTLLDKDSMYNTPPCWCIYMTGLVMDYLQNEVGGLEEMAKINHAKAKVLYDYLDGQDFYNNPVQPEYRSMMNVTFTSPNPDMDKKFCAAATEAGFVNLKGHRLVGGMRASIYNAMPAQGVNDLVDFMEKFRKENA